MVACDKIRLTCERALSGHRRLSVRAMISELASSPLAELPPDLYGKGEAIEALEGEVARLLGKPAAMFVIKGVVAQQAALRTWSERSGRRTVALHRKSHIDLDEHGAYERLHGLIGIRLGGDHQPLCLRELSELDEPLGAAVIELPLRRAGFLLPQWEELVAMSEWCGARRVPLHFDGARLWEAAPYYDRSLADIAALSDSVYVSFYKGLGGLGGAILAGPERFIAEARVWHARQCGALMTAFPFIFSAHDGLRRHLPRMAAYFERARNLAAALRGIPDVCVSPEPPQCNSFQLTLPAPADRLRAAHLELAKADVVWLFGRFAETTRPDRAMTEIVIGDAADDLCDDEVTALVARLVEQATAA